MRSKTKGADTVATCKQKIKTGFGIRIILNFQNKASVDVDREPHVWNPGGAAYKSQRERELEIMRLEG